MIPDQARMLANLNRTARTAGHDTILETWKLKRLLAAAELAEADLAHDEAAARWLSSQRAKADRDDISAKADAHWDAQAAYRVARESEIR